MIRFPEIHGSSGPLQQMQMVCLILLDKSIANGFRSLYTCCFSVSQYSGEMGNRKNEETPVPP